MEEVSCPQVPDLGSSQKSSISVVRFRSIAVGLRHVKVDLRRISVVPPEEEVKTTLFDESNTKYLVDTPVPADSPVIFNVPPSTVFPLTSSVAVGDAVCIPNRDCDAERTAYPLLLV